MNSIRSILNMIRTESVEGRDTISCQDYDRSLHDSNACEDYGRALSINSLSHNDLRQAYPLQVFRRADGRVVWSRVDLNGKEIN